MANLIGTRGFVHTLFVTVLAGVALSGGPALSQYYVSTGAGVGRCAFTAGKVPNGRMSVIVCSGAGLDVFAYDGTPSVYPQSPVWGYAYISTNKGTDRAFFRFDPTNPDTSKLSSFVMDPIMTTAQISFTAGSITVNLTLNGTGTPFPSESSWLNHYLASSPIICASTGADAGLSRTATISSGSTVRSSRVGGGSVSSATGSLTTDLGGGLDTCAYLGGQ